MVEVTEPAIMTVEASALGMKAASAALPNKVAERTT
jgi:hypothetical protein